MIFFTGMHMQCNALRGMGDLFGVDCQFLFCLNVDALGFLLASGHTWIGPLVFGQLIFLC